MKKFSILKRVFILLSVIILFLFILLGIFGDCSSKKIAFSKYQEEYIENPSDAKAKEELKELLKKLEESAEQPATNAEKVAREAVEKALRELREVASKKGGVGYAIPEQMKVGKEYDVRAFIEHPKHFKQQKAQRYLDSFAKESKKALGKDAPDFIIKIDSLMVYEVMNMQLIDPSEDHFIIKKHISEQEQVIDNLSRTVWRWKIVPKKSGNHDLVIKATAKIKTATSGLSKKDIEVYTKVIRVKANIPYTIWDAIKNNWQWMWGALFIPFIYPLGKRIIKWWRKRNDPQGQAGFRR